MEAKCPKCGSERLKKNGTRSGLQKYQCKECGAYFGQRRRKSAFVKKASGW
jgi:transposase-like protein